MQGFLRGASGGPLFDGRFLLSCIVAIFLAGAAVGALVVWIF